MRSLLFLFFLHSFVLCGWSQTFNKRYGVNDLIGNTYHCSSATYANDNIYIHITESGAIRSWVYKISMDGELTDAYSYGDTDGYIYPSWANYIHPFGEDKLVFSTIYERNSDGIVFGRITTIDYDGNLLWQKNYGDSLHDHIIYQVRPTSDGGLIAVGSAVFIQGYPAFYVLKTDSEGNEQWHKYLGDEMLFRNGGWIDELQDHSGFAVAGYEDVTNYDPAGLLYIIDTDGEIVNQRKYIDWGIYDYQGVESIQSCSNGGYVFSTRYNTQEVSQFYFKNIPQIVKINDNLDTLWTCNLVPNYSGNSVQTVIENTQGDFVAVGSTQLRPQQQTNALYEGYISKVSSEGDLLWSRYYYHAEFGDNYLYDIDELPNGGYLCAGLAYNYGPFGDTVDARSGWLLALDSVGCLVPGCDTLGVGITELNPVQFSIYPNPADQFINIAFSKHESMSDAVIRLYDMQGRVLKSVSITHPQATYMLDSAALDCGTYFVKIEGKGVVATQKVMVVH